MSLYDKAALAILEQLIPQRECVLLLARYKNLWSDICFQLGTVIAEFFIGKTVRFGNPQAWMFY